MTDSRKTTVRRAALRRIFEERAGFPQILRALAYEVGDTSRAVRYDIEWLRRHWGMKIEPVRALKQRRRDGRDVEVLRGMFVYMGSLLDEPIETAHPGAVYPILGICDECGRKLKIDGHTRFCHALCRDHFNKRSPQDRMKKVLGLLGEVGDKTISDPTTIYEEPKAEPAPAVADDDDDELDLNQTEAERAEFVRKKTANMNLNDLSTGPPVRYKDAGIVPEDFGHTDKDLFGPDGKLFNDKR